MNRAVKAQIDAVPRSPGVYISARATARSSTSARRSHCEPVFALTSRPAARRASGRRSSSSASPISRRFSRARGGRAPSRADADQALPAALQHPASRRQVVPVHRRDRGGRVPARDVHARATPERRRLLRAVREREEGARDAGRAQPRVPLPSVRRAATGQALRYPLSRLPHRSLSRAVRREDRA